LSFYDIKCLEFKDNLVIAAERVDQKVKKKAKEKNGNGRK